MSVVMELLYQAWVGEPKPDLWPDYLKDFPIKGHGEYAFQVGLRLGLLLAAEALFPETRS